MKQRFSVYNIVIAIILVLFLVIGSLIIFVNPEHKPAPNPTASDMEESAAHPKPVFRKDGELSFKNEKANKLISIINIEVADNDAEREQGLMYRDSMAENIGMLFLMDKEEPQVFWMKNTIMPLDIMFADSSHRIVSVHKNCKPYSLDQIPSEKPALYVVEVNAGYSSKYGIKVGDLISFQFRKE